jgi:hypothetical protein
VRVEVRFTLLCESADSGFHVKTRQKRPRGRKNFALRRSRNVFVLKKPVSTAL